MYARALHGNREVSSSATGESRSGPHREGDEPKPMMHDGEKSDPAIVAQKPANKVEQSAAESVERRAGAEENANQDGTLRTPSRAGVSNGLDRVRTAARLGKWPSKRFAVNHPRWEPYALIGPVRICAGGAQ